MLDESDVAICQFAGSWGQPFAGSWGQGDGANNRYEGASDRTSCPRGGIRSYVRPGDESFAGSWGQSRDQRRLFERRRSEGTFIAGVFGGASSSSIFGLSLERYDSPSTTKS